MKYTIKNRFLMWFVFTIILMVIVPWLTVTFINSDAGMAVCFILFYAVNPIYSIIMGIEAGKNVRSMWSLPIISSVLFLFGTWIFFDIGEIAFVLYAGIYLVIGLVALILSAVIRKNKNAVHARFNT